MAEHNIIPKVAYVKCDADVDDFLADWQEDENPTQEDYDEWAVEQMWAVLCSGGLYMDDIELMEDT
jgi:hypothetical protein